MRNSAFLVLGLGVVIGCASSTDSSSGSDPTPSVASSPPADEPPSLADEASRTDLVCSAEEETGEAREPLTPLMFACQTLVGACFGLGCGWALQHACPSGAWLGRRLDTEKSKWMVVTAGATLAVAMFAMHRFWPPAFLPTLSALGAVLVFLAVVRAVKDYRARTSR